MLAKCNGAKSYLSPAMEVRAKANSGVLGLDEITGGGLPCGRTTLLVGGPGSGKTILALQFLVQGARYCREPGIFVAFEETSGRIAANAEGFGWNLRELRRKKKLSFMDAQPTPDLIQVGDFDLSGMLAALDAQIKDLGAKRIVFDALDIVLELMPDFATKRREVYKLHQWLLARKITAVITSKAGGDDSISIGQESFGFMQFMVDCAVVLNHSVVTGVSQRNLRVQKYRGTSFDENQSPFVIGKGGIEVGVARTLGRVDAKVTNERVSSGVGRLDTMLGGGYYRGACVLITGFPGTAKTTLSGAFAEAACGRGERTMFVSFDSDGSEVIRNLASVGIRLERHVKSGCLRMVSARTISGSAETFLVRIKTLAKEQRARCVVIDPVSTLSQSGNELTAHSVAERLFDWLKCDGTTLVCTSLLDEVSQESDSGHGSSLQISKIADTWIHLNYLMQAGERNRGISIVKSRGTSHSNQMRELILSGAGVTLTDVYTAGGEVLMGSLRSQRESADRATKEIAELAGNLRRVKLNAEEAELEVRMKSLQVELTAKQVEKQLLIRTSQNIEGELSQDRTRMREMRGSDAVNGESK
jgi:circadian clock protein KaiC